MVNCEFCGKAYNTTQGLGMHKKYCINNPNKIIINNAVSPINCKFCNKECKNNNSLINHERLCKLNPNKQESNFIAYNKIRIAWNKDLTKETDTRVLQNANNVSNTLKEKVLSGWKPYFATDKYWTFERKQYMRDLKIEYYKLNPEKHPNILVAGNRNKMTYPEQLINDWLTTHGYNFISQYKTSFNDSIRYVDFYLPDYNLYIEVDGEYWHADKSIDTEKDLYAKNIQHINTLRLSTKDRIIEKLDLFFK